MPQDRTSQPNHLAGQTSPYLLQHLYNPVDWYPWGRTALERAVTEDRPIFLSIGYAACHWCHVMERESFENPAIAEALNRHFVPIKVDREERPDLDEIYMNAVQLLTGQGGWPLSVFLTPDLRPFMGGTYFPPEDRWGRIGFPQLLERIRRAWEDSREDVDGSATRLAEELRRVAAGPPQGTGRDAVGRAEVARAAAELAQRFEPVFGGFGPAPKFPPDGAIGLLLGEHARTGERMPLEMAERTLDGMARGGMYDHVGGGFARYSVDDRWCVPHFEKMLYNQALLVPNYVEAWLLTGKPAYRRVVEETLDFVRRELTAPDGGFFSSLDADSEGVEGKFYVWTADEIDAVLGVTDGAFYRSVYGITAEGNFEGANIPNLIERPLDHLAAAAGQTETELVERLAPLNRALRRARERRVRPATDDKILTAWNGLMITAFSRAHQAFGRRADLDAARAAAGFVLSNLTRGDRLLVSFRAGAAHLNGYLDDYAFLARGLVDLYEAGFDPRHLERADALAATLIDRFEDRKDGGFFFTSDDHETLLTRNHSLHDGALPAGSGVAAEVLLRLAAHRDRPRFRAVAERTLVACRGPVERMPSAHAALLVAAELAAAPPLEVAILGSLADEATTRLLDVARRRHRARPVIQLAETATDVEGLSLLSGKRPLHGRPTAFVCRQARCSEPTSDPSRLAELLAEA